MKILILTEADESNKLATQKIKNFKKYIQQAIKYQESLGERNVRVVLKYEGVGSKIGAIKGILIFNPIKDKDWIIDSTSQLNVNKAMKWQSDDDSLKFIITGVDYDVNPDATGSVEDKGYISVIIGEEETHYTFSVESYG